MSGYYRMARGWMDHPVFAAEPYSRAQAWCWLIERAAWKPIRVDVVGHTEHLDRGQLSYSTRYMAAAFGWSEAKVRRFLTRLKTDAMIDATSDAGQTVVTICNYNKYQATQETIDAPSDAPSDAEATQERRRSDANKKKGKEGKEGKTGSVGVIAATQFEAFWRVYPSRRPHTNPKKTACDKFTAAIKRGIDPHAIIEGAERYAEYVQREVTNPRFISQAKTWLEAEAWGEDHGEPTRKPTEAEIAG